MILGGATTDSRFGGTGPNGQVLPSNPNKEPLQPVIDLAPFQQRWQLMRLEFMSKWYQRLRDISRHINPKRGFFEGFVPNQGAHYDYKLIVDDNPAHYARILAAGMQSGLTSPALPWFRSGIGNPELEAVEDVKLWLAYVDKVLYDIFAASNFYDATHQTYEELGLFGTGSFGMFEDYEKVLRCRTYTIGEYYIACDFKGRPNAFARQYWMTVDQLVEEFGWKNVSDQVQATYSSGNRDQYFLIYTLCEPNTSMLKGFADYRGMPWRSITWEAVSKQKKALRVKGYHEFPYNCPRWDLTTTADTYGNGPGAFSLGNIKMLYRMQKDSLLAINKIADPPVQADASVEGTVNMLPGGVTRTSATVPNAGVRPAYQINPDINAIEMKIEKTDKKIASRFYADLFLMMINSTDTEKTAREIVERHEEKLFMLGPVIGRVKTDMLDPAYSRAFSIAMRAGLIPPAPKSIQGMNIQPRYISMLAQAQKMAGTAVIEQNAAFVGSLASVYPEVKDVFDPDEAVRAMADMTGLTPKIIRSEEQVAEIRAEKIKAMQQQQALATAQAMADGAKTLSETPVGAGNALGHILGIGGEFPGVGQPTPGGTA